MKYVYCDGKLSQGFCAHLTAKQVRVLLDTKEARETFALAEDLLQFFHMQCVDATKKVTLADMTKFYGNLDKNVFSALLGNGSQRGDGQAAAAERKCLLLQTAIAFYKRLQKICGDAVALPPWPWPTAAALDVAAVPTSTAASLAPRLIQYSAEGKPLCAQVVLTSSSEDFNWLTFMDTACVSDALFEDQGRAAVISALHRTPVLLTSASLCDVAFAFSCKCNLRSDCLVGGCCVLSFGCLLCSRLVGVGDFVFVAVLLFFSFVTCLLLASLRVVW